MYARSAIFYTFSQAMLGLQQQEESLEFENFP